MIVSAGLLMDRDFATFAKITQEEFAIMSISAVCDSRNTGGMDLDEIKRGLEKPGKTKIGLAKALGLDPAAVTRLVQGKRQIKVAEIQAIRDYFKDEDDAGSEIEHPPGEDIRDAPSILKHTMPDDVPVHGTAVGGSVGDFEINGQTVDWIRRPPALRNARNAFAIFYSNDSMFPAFEAGDPLYVNPAIPPRAGDYIIIEMHPARDGSPGAAYVKRLISKNAKVLIAEQYNPPTKDLKFDMTKVKSVWRIVPTRELLGV